MQLEGHAEDAQAGGLRDDREQLPKGRSGPLWVAVLGRRMDPVKVESFQAPACDARGQGLASVPACACVHDTQRHSPPTCKALTLVSQAMSCA